MGLTLVDLSIQALDASLTNAKVSASAAIAYSKLASLTSGNLLVGSAGNVATSVAMSGDITIIADGTTAIGNTKVTNAMLAGSIADAKLALDYVEVGGDAMTGALAMGANKITGLAAGSGTGDAARYDELILKANIASPTFTGTVSGVTATMVGLGNVTNESKATMFTSPTFTGTTSGVTATMVGLGNVTNESKATMFTSPTFTGSVATFAMGTAKITGLGTPTAGTDAATKAYADSVASGLDVKDSCQVASTADIAGTYANTGGTSARGQFTAMSNANIDGYALVAGDRILMKDQTGSGAENGIWVITTLGTGSDGVWDRAEDFDADAEVTSGAFTFVTNGTANGAKGYVLTTADTITIGGASGTVLVFSQFSSAASDADTLDGVDSTSFLRSDASDSVTTGVTLNMDSGSTLSIDGTWDIGGTGVTSTAAELNLLDGRTGTVWTSDNDGTGTGLDADTVDGSELSVLLRTDASTSVLTGNTLTTNSGSTMNIAGTFQIGGSAMTSTAAELNILDGATVTVTELNALGTIVTRETVNEAPTGSLAVFTIDNAPIAGSEEVFLNGVLQDEGGLNDYTISGATITFTFNPPSGAKIRVNSRY